MNAGQIVFVPKVEVVKFSNISELGNIKSALRPPFYFAFAQGAETIRRATSKRISIASYNICPDMPSVQNSKNEANEQMYKCDIGQEYLLCLIETTQRHP
jgi:hypothetical protein